jgi:hypothetical protein
MKVGKIHDDGIPEDVWFVWIASQQPMGLEMYEKCQKIINENPKYFPWEHKYNSIPKEVHEAYLDEKYPNRHEPFIGGGSVGRGILELINEQPVSFADTEEKSLVEIFESVINFQETARKQREKQYQKDKALWDKHYKKYGLKYRP